LDRSQREQKNREAHVPIVASRPGQPWTGVVAPILVTSGYSEAFSMSLFVNPIGGRAVTHLVADLVQGIEATEKGSLVRIYLCGTGIPMRPLNASPFLNRRCRALMIGSVGSGTGIYHEHDSS
jgi:hypothetical protein